MKDNSSRMAANSAIRAFGEVVGKLASVAFYVAIARELGDAQFGDFMFGLSISTVLLSLAGLGTSELITREVARDHEAVNRYFSDTMAFKTLFTILLLGLLAGYLAIAGYPGETIIAVLLIGLGVGIELMSQVPYSVFVGNERMGYVATSLVAQRIFTSVVGVAALLLGAGLLVASLIFVAGSLIGLASALIWMLTKVVRPRLQIDVHRWLPIVKAALPLGLVAFLYTILIKLDITLLSLLTGGVDDNSEVGQYGAAFRLIEATMFIGWSFSAATMPWLSRQRDGGEMTHSRGYALGAKALLAVLVPVGLCYGLLARPLIDVIYGPEYEPAIALMQILAPMAILFGWNVFVSAVLIARDMPSGFTKAALVVLAQNVVFNLILIPKFGATGAAVSSVSSGVLLAILTIRPITAAVGKVKYVQVLVAPIAGGLVMAAVCLAVGVDHMVISGVAGAIAFAAAFLAVERLLYREDFAIYASLISRLRSRSRLPEDHAPVGSELGM